MASVRKRKMSRKEYTTQNTLQYSYVLSICVDLYDKTEER